MPRFKVADSLYEGPAYRPALQVSTHHAELRLHLLGGVPITHFVISELLTSTVRQLHHDFDAHRWQIRATTRHRSVNSRLGTIESELRAPCMRPCTQSRSDLGTTQIEWRDAQINSWQSLACATVYLCVT
jgi:hypothetical protein